MKNLNQNQPNANQPPSTHNKLPASRAPRPNVPAVAQAAGAYLERVAPADRLPVSVHEAAVSMFAAPDFVTLTEEQKEILYAPVDPNSICIRQHDGQIYLPSAAFRALLTRAFPMGWMMMPAEPLPRVENNLVIWGFYLKIQSTLMGYAVGAHEYRPNNPAMNWDDAMEAAKSNALTRLCKSIGMAAELWDPVFISSWKSKHVESYSGVNSRGKTVTLWRKKSAAMRNCFRIVKEELKWTDEQSRVYLRSHCPTLNQQTGELSFRAVPSRSKYTPQEWSLQEDNLKRMVNDPGLRPNFNAPETKQVAEKQPVSADVKLAPAEKAAGAVFTPSPFPVNGEVSDCIQFFADWLGVTLQAVTSWVEINYVCNIEKLYASQEKNIKDRLHDFYVSNIKDKLRADVDKMYSRFFGEQAIGDASGKMLHALAECSSDQVELFLERLNVKKSSSGAGPRQVRLMTHEQIVIWEETLKTVLSLSEKSAEPEPELGL